ncbi:MAG: prepilin-type N-terminal cleavage/methylation domain-containing protein [Phycisphaerales bacterium]|nr:prepilin-type N-terminal cleavage/methylation domain-containing protein [Phycisphaerales bacterium]
MTRKKPSIRTRRAFSLVEMLIALAISSALLVATLFALQTSFFAYQVTADQASTHAVGRLVIHRMMAMIRAGQDFRPFPSDIRERYVASDYLEFYHPDTGQVVTITWDRNSGQLLYSIDGGYNTVLLEGVIARTDENGALVQPFLLEWEPGRRVHRVTIDLMIIPDDSVSTSADGYLDESANGGQSTTQPIRLVASAMPRSAMF